MSLFSKKTPEKKVEATNAAAPNAAPAKDASMKVAIAKATSAKVSLAKAASAKAAKAPKAAPAPVVSSTFALAGQGKTLHGVVVSTKMKDTIVVKVDRFEKVAKYERFMKISKKYKAHDTDNSAVVGSIVNIQETRPISKDKNFIIVK